MAQGGTTTEPSQAGPTTYQGLSVRLRGFVTSFRLIIITIAIALAFQAANPAFLSPENLTILFRSMVALALIGFAQLFVIIVGELDLSVGAVYGLSAVTFVAFWTGGGNAPFQLPFFLALILGLSVGLAAGVVNSFFTMVVGIPSFIATLGMLSIASGLELLLSNASTFTPAYIVPPPPQGELDFFRALGATRLPFGIPMQILWLAFFFVVFWIIRHRTLFGFRLLAVGGNRDAARIARLPVNKYIWITFLLTGFMASVAGILDFSYLGSVGPNSGGALTFPVFASVVIGGAALVGGSGTIVGTLIGATLLAIIRNGLAMIGVGAFGGLIVTGAVTIGAVSIDALVRRRRKE